MRVTSNDAFVLEVPAVAASTSAGQVTIDLAALPASPAAQAEIDAAFAAAAAAQQTADDAQIDATQALADAAVALAEAGYPEVLTVRTLADLPAPVGGVITIPGTHKAIRVLANVDISPNRVVLPDHFMIFGCGGTNTGFVTAHASPMFTGRRLILRDVGLQNTAGAVVRIAGTGPGDTVAGLRAQGCGFAGADALGGIQLHDVDFATIKDSVWTSGSGVGVRLTGEVGRGYFGESLVRSNAAGFTWLQIPGGGAATITGKQVIHSLGFDLLDGGNGIDADPAALPDESLHVEICVFPDPTTPGIGAPTLGVDADSPECHFAGNLNLENTHIRGVLTIASNATATTVSNTTDYFKLAGTTTLADASLFDSPEAGTLRVLAPGSIRARLTAFVTLTTATNNQDLYVVFAIRPGGVGAPTLLTAFLQEGLTGGAAGLRINALPMLAIVTLNNDDWIDVRVRNTSGANNVTWRHGQVYAEEIGG